MNSHTSSHKPKAIVLLLALLSATAFLSYSWWLLAAASSVPFVEDF